jgi:hypothetical protein
LNQSQGESSACCPPRPRQADSKWTSPCIVAQVHCPLCKIAFPYAIYPIRDISHQQVSSRNISHNFGCATHLHSASILICRSIAWYRLLSTYPQTDDQPDGRPSIRLFRRFKGVRTLDLGTSRHIHLHDHLIRCLKPSLACPRLSSSCHPIPRSPRRRSESSSIRCVIGMWLMWIPPYQTEAVSTQTVKRNVKYLINATTGVAC